MLYDTARTITKVKVFVLMLFVIGTRQNVTKNHT